MTPQDLLTEYERRINSHDFGQMLPLIAPDAILWFSDGTHEGIDSIRAAFERTWKTFENDTYWLEVVRWLAIDEDAAVCAYRFNWKTLIRGEPVAGSGRGTTAMRRSGGRWWIIHEHLSANAWWPNSDIWYPS